MSKRPRTADDLLGRASDLIDTSDTIQQTFDEMMAAHGGKKRRDKKRTNISAMLAHSSSRPPGTRLDVSTSSTVTPRIKTKREIMGLNSPPNSPRDQAAFRIRGGGRGPEDPKPPTDPRLRLAKYAQKRKDKELLQRRIAAGRAGMAVDEADIAQRQAQMGLGKQSLQHIQKAIYAAKYPNPTENFYRAAQHVLIQHKIPRRMEDEYAPKIAELLQNSHMSEGHYRTRDLNKIIKEAREAMARPPEADPNMPHLDVGTASETTMETRDESRTEPPPPATPPTAPSPTRFIIDLQEESAEPDVAALGEIRPAVGDGGYSPIVSSPSPSPPQDEIDAEHAHRDDEERPAGSEVPQTPVDHLHEAIEQEHGRASLPPFGAQSAFEMPLPPSPSMEAIVLKEGEINPDFAERLADAESVTPSDTMSHATSYGQHFPEDVSMSEASQSLFGGHDGAREPAAHIFQAVEGIDERAAYMENIYRFRRPTFLRTANKQAVAYSNNPVKQSLSMNFGSMLSRDRKIKLRSGTILSSRGKAVIKCSKKTPADVHAINGFLKTEYPYGAKVGGSKYSLVALIPKVLKSLPGTVTLST